MNQIIEDRRILKGGKKSRENPTKAKKKKQTEKYMYIGKGTVKKCLAQLESSSKKSVI